MPRIAIQLLLAFVLIVGGSLEGYAAKRIALVIGNGAYQQVAKLPNPDNDARAVATALERLGFAVTLKVDLDYSGLRRALSAFSRAVAGADVAAIFYAGHGIEVGGQNFLLPTDAKLTHANDVDFEAIPLTAAMGALESAKGLKLVILDACRNNPFAVKMVRAGATRSVGRGLARVSPRGSDTLVAYAAKEGTTADDGKGTHSPYTAALLKHLETPGLEIRLLFGRVRDSVLANTGRRQEPFTYGSLGGEAIFLKGGDAPAAVVPVSAAAEAWSIIKDTKNVDDLAAFIRRFPDSFYSDLAKARQKKLQESKVAVGQYPGQPKRPANSPSARPSKPATLRVVSWGGAYSASQLRAYHKPYMRLNPGIKIINDDSAAESLAQLRAQVEAGNVTWSLVDMVVPDAVAACNEGLLLPIPHDEWLAPAPDGTPASKDFIAGSLSECFIPQIVYSTTFGYRTDAFGGIKPTSIRDVFDLKKFPGRRALKKEPNGNLEWALIADGVPAAKVYDILETPAGVNRALRKLDTIKKYVTWWTKGAQPVQLLADKKVVMASGYNGRLFSAIAHDRVPIGMLWDYQFLDLDGWVIPKGAKNLEEVKKLVKFATDTQRLADQAKYIAYGPARRSSAPLVGRHADLGIDMSPHTTTNRENMRNAILVDHDWWADHRAELHARFQEWLSR